MAIVLSCGLLKGSGDSSVFLAAGQLLTTLRLSCDPSRHDTFHMEWQREHFCQMPALWHCTSNLYNCEQYVSLQLSLFGMTEARLKHKVLTGLP